jgi:hypothetical protein
MSLLCCTIRTVPSLSIGDEELLSASVERVQVDNQLFMTPYPALLYPLQVSAHHKIHGIA